MDTNEIVGKKIREFRTNKKYSQGELAEKAGISRSYLHRMETGANNISVRRLAEVANALGIEIQHFFGESEGLPITDDEKEIVSFYKELRKEGINAEKVKKWLRLAKEMND